MEEDTCVYVCVCVCVCERERERERIYIYKFIFFWNEQIASNFVCGDNNFCQSFN